MSDLDSKLSRLVRFDLPLADVDRPRAVLWSGARQLDRFSFRVIELDAGNGGYLVAEPRNVAQRGISVLLNADRRIRHAVAQVNAHGARCCRARAPSERRFSCPRAARRSQSHRAPSEARSATLSPRRSRGPGVVDGKVAGLLPRRNDVSYCVAPVERPWRSCPSPRIRWLHVAAALGPHPVSALRRLPALSVMSFFPPWVGRRCGRIIRG